MFGSRGLYVMTSGTLSSLFCSSFSIMTHHKEGLEALEKTLQNEDVPRNKIETIIDFSHIYIPLN